MRLWARILKASSPCWDQYRRPRRAEPRSRLSMLKTMSICHRGLSVFFGKHLCRCRGGSRPVCRQLRRPEPSERRRSSCSRRGRADRFTCVRPSAGRCQSAAPALPAASSDSAGRSDAWATGSGASAGRSDGGRCAHRMASGGRVAERLAPALCGPCLVPAACRDAAAALNIRPSSGPDVMAASDVKPTAAPHIGAGGSQKDARQDDQSS